MNLQPPLSDRIQHHRIIRQRVNPAPHIQLHQLQAPRLLIHTLKQLQVLPPQLPQRHQPRVNQPQLLVPQRRRNPTAGGVSAHDDVLDFQVLHGVLDDGQRIEVRGDEDVGDVAVDEDVAGVEAEDGGFWAAGVGTADPEDLRGLALGEALEEGGLLLRHRAAPFGVRVEDPRVGVRRFWAGVSCGVWKN